MDFRLRRFGFLLTLLILFWALAQAKHEPAQFRVSTDGHSSPPEFAGVIELARENAADLGSVPFVALDNTCRYEVKGLELSACTGLVSGEAAALYRFALAQEAPLLLVLRPIRKDFDAALSLFHLTEGDNWKCVGGSDLQLEGQIERLPFEQLPAGVYYLAVSGYGADCGQFELTAESRPATPVSLREFTCTAGDSGTVVRWETHFEADLHHFKLYRSGRDGEGREAIFQPRSRGDFSRGASYEFFDEGAHQGLSYDLIALDDSGREIPL